MGIFLNNTLLLNQKDVKQLLTMKETVDICHKTFKSMGQNKTHNPAKVSLDLGESTNYPPYDGFMNAMPSYVGWLDVAGLKWAGGILGERRKLGLPYVTSLILLINPKIGNFLSVMDGAHITNYRTGAQTANALHYIKKNTNNIKVGLYGAGMQARTQIMALSEVFNIEQITVYDISIDSSKKFQKDMADYIKGEIIIANSPEEAANADTVICVTQAKEPFLKEKWIKPGTVVFLLGSYQESEDSLIINSDHIIVDHVEQCLHRGALSELSKRGSITEEDIYATIGELSINKKEISSLHNKKIVCVPIGTGALDIAVAKTVLDKAKEKGLGETYSFL